MKLLGLLLFLCKAASVDPSEHEVSDRPLPFMTVHDWSVIEFNLKKAREYALHRCISNFCFQVLKQATRSCTMIAMQVGQVGSPLEQQCLQIMFNNDYFWN